MSTEIKTQVVVLGAGPAGYSAAFRCADLGLETILVERYSTLGGLPECGLYPFQGTVTRCQSDRRSQSAG